MDLRELLDVFDRLVAAAEGVAPREAVEAAAAVGRRSRARRGYLGDTVVVALAGGTGSGKSSIVNALAGEEVSPAGPRRPTTGRPMAWIPGNPEPGLVRLLDDLGIENRVGHDALEWLAVIDLPDTDSVVVEHRATVESLLPEVDAVVWVVDPEKYQDRLLHAGYLQPLSVHGDRFRFVLNQIDRVAPGDREPLIRDLAQTLEADGISSPWIVATSADPPLGSPEGIDALIETLEALGEAKRVVGEKIVTDLDVAARDLTRAAGVGEGGGTGFAERWDDVRREAAGILAGAVAGAAARERAGAAGASGARSVTGLLRGGRSPSEVALPKPGSRGVAEATSLVASFVDRLAADVEGETRSAIRDVGIRVDDEVAWAADAVAAGDVVPLPGPPGWWSAVAWVRRLGAVAAALGLVWAVDRVLGGGELLPAAITIVAGLAAMVLPRALAVADGRRRAVAAVEQVRSDVTGHVSRELDRRIGRPLRSTLRERAGVAAAAAEFGLALAELRDREILT